MLNLIKILDVYPNILRSYIKFCEEKTFCMGCVKMTNKCLVRNHFRALKMVFFIQVTKNVTLLWNLCADIECASVRLEFFNFLNHFKIVFWIMGVYEPKWFPPIIFFQRCHTIFFTKHSRDIDAHTDVHTRTPMNVRAHTLPLWKPPRDWVSYCCT
jgi:hypothetical protein